MKTIAFIPVRCGSKSIPMKNIRPFCGEPMVYWTLKALADTDAIDEIWVATDCAEIEETVMDFELPRVDVYRRRAENATDTASTESVMLEFIEARKLEDTDRFLLVQATSPLTQSADIAAALEKVNEGDSLLTCVRLKRFFWNEDGTPANYDYRARPRRQEFDGELMENGAFYINRVGNIRKDKNRLSGKIVIYEMPEYTDVELDEEHDWVKAESLMRKFILG